MKAEDMARAIVDEWRDGVKWSFPDLQDRITQAIKEQDRDTRHACAVAINNLPWEIPGDNESVLFGSEAVVSRDSAHAACMNTEAV